MPSIEELKNTEERYRLILENQNDLIYIVNQKLGIEYINTPVFKRQLGYTIEDFKKNDILFAVHPDDKTKALKAIKKGIKKATGTIEIRIRDRKGNYHFHEITGKLFTDFDGIQKALIISRDITEKKEYEYKLKQSEENYRLITENANDTIGILNRKFIFEFANKHATFNVLGYKPSEVVGKSVLDFLHPLDKEKGLNALLKGLHEKEGIKELRGMHKNGTSVWLEIKGRVFVDKYGENKGILIGRDISERKKVEKEISDLAKFPSENPNPVLRVDKNKILYINQSGKNLFRTTEDEKIPILLEKMVDQAFYDKEIKNIEIQIDDKFYSFDIAPIQQEMYANIYGQDITARKKSEIALNDEKQFTEDILNSTLDTIFVFDPDTGKALRWNKTFKEISGYSDEEISSKKAPNSYYSEEDLKTASEAIQKLREEGENTLELSFITRDGKKIPYEYNATVLEDSEGKISIVSIGRDVTERKEAEQKLKESEEIFRTITEQSFLGIAIIQDNVIKYVNKKLAHTYGYTVEEAMSWGEGGFLNVVHPKDRKMVAEQAQKKQMGDLNAINKYQFRGIKKNGDIVWLEIFSKTINYKGKLADFVTVHDITDKKLADQNLKESEEKYRNLFDNAPFAIVLFNIEGIILDCNDAASKITGYSKEELLGNNFRRFKFYVDMNTANLEERQKLTSNGNIPTPREVLLYRKDGSQFWARTHVEFIQMREKTYIQAIIHDITEQKQAQIELEKSYERLKEQGNIINKSPGVLFLWKNSEGWPVEFVSENVKQFGYTREDFYSGKVIYGEIIHSDDLERVVEEVKIYSNEDINEFVQEYRIITKSGQAKWLDDRTWIRRDSEGNITHFQGTVLDITDRKAAEEALKSSESNYKDAFDMANFYKDLFTHDMNNILQIINSSAEIISFQLGESEKSMFIENMTKMIRSQIDRGSKLISDVRTLTSLDEEDIITNKIEITRFLESSIKFVKKAYRERNVLISPENFEEKHFTTANDLLQDVFENIFINGIKYNESEIVEIKINLSKQKIEERDYIQIEFIDNGIGVSDNKKKLIFQPGYREIKGTKGMGIGLSLVSKIMEIFEGKIWVEDKIKGDYTQGSRFIVLLPETR